MNPSFRNYRIPAFADVPRSEIYFADTYDSFGPLGAKSMSEAPINPIAPAMANALADATGIRFCDLPFRPDRIYRPIHELERPVALKTILDVTYRNEAGRPPPNLPLVRGRDFQRYRFHCCSPLAGCGKSSISQ